MKTNIFNRTIIGSLALAALCLTATSCLRDNGTRPETEHGVMRLDFEVEAIASATRGTILPKDGEDTVNMLYLLLFEYTTDGSGAYAATIALDAPFSTAQSYTIPLEENGLSTTGNYAILALANVDPTANGNINTGELLQSLATMTEKQAVAHANLYITGAGTDEQDNSHAIVSNNLPMSATAVRMAGDESTDITLKRFVVHFDITNDISDQYTIMSASIWGAASTTPIWNSGQRAVPERTKRFYGVGSPDGGLVLEEGVVEGLYAFENFVETPGPADTETTCLIFGLQPAGGGSTRYYRVNIAAKGESQSLVRNNVYRLHLTGISGEGAGNEYDAWAKPTGGRLDVSIDAWGMDDNGLIITDGVSTLVMPTRMTRIVPEGTVHEYTVATYGPGDAPTISKNDLPAGITATLDGSRLVITATAMPPELDERRGVIELSFAGLHGTITVIQSPMSGLYLDLNQYEVPTYDSRGRTGAATPFEVTASGGWTATIYNILQSGGDTSNPGFSFAAAGSPQTTLLSTSNPGNSFQVYTTGDNPSNADERNSFMVVSLDADPITFSRTIPLVQRPATEVVITPMPDRALFSSAGVPQGITGATADKGYVFTIEPGMVGGAANSWNVMVSGTDAQYFYVEKTDTEGAQQQFTLWARGTTTPASYPNNENKHINLSTNTLNATVVITVGDIATPILIPVQQQPFSFTVMRTSPAGTVPVSGTVLTGGVPTKDYVEFTIDMSDPVEWSAVFTANNGTASDGRTLVHHAPTFTDEQGNALVSGQAYSGDTKIRVAYPKVYYPNRDIPMSVDIAITVAGTTETVTTGQDVLTDSTIDAYGLYQDYIYGRINDAAYQTAFYNAVRALPGFRNTGDEQRFATATSIPAGTDYLQLVPGIINSSTASNYTWAAVDEFLKNGNGWMTFVCEYTYVTAVNNAYSPIRKAWSTPLVYNGGTSKLWQNDSKVYHYLMDQGKTPLAPSSLSTFSDDDISSYFSRSGLPASAVVMFVESGSGLDDHATLVIDVENGFMFRGGLQQFDSVSDGNKTFLDNLMYFIENASKYGTNFTDLLLEGDNGGTGPRVLPNGRVAQPAPWDTYWGANAE